MSSRQRAVLIVLAIAVCVVWAGLVGAVVLTPRLAAGRGRTAPTAVAAGTQDGTAVLPPTWTPTPSRTPAPTDTRAPTWTPGATRTPVDFPTVTPCPTDTPEPTTLQNGSFDGILYDRVPGWQVEATVNWEPGMEFDPGSSFGQPRFSPADDPQRVINGTTLQIDTHQWVKFQLTLYQVVDVAPGSTAQFQVSARGYSASGGIQVRAGIDAGGREACLAGRWGDLQVIDDRSGVVVLRSPPVVVGEEGRVTVCFFAEPQFSAVSNAAFFDDALLTVTSSP